MSNKKLNGADYLLLLLYLDNKSPILGAIRLEKMMFLFNNEIAPRLKETGLDSDKLPEFIAYNFGPFSKDVYEQVELFKGIGFLRVTNLMAKEELIEADDWEEGPFSKELDYAGFQLNDEKRYYKYQMLDLGADYVSKKICPELTAEQLAMLLQFKKKITSLSPKQILRYVYTKYPDFTSNSLIKNEVFDDD
ncbi:MAG: hypothetical protein L6V89_01485 [Oscillospiraceae bacterium]|nr:MAG: hypothetical protein L6V89_01485 [Oscillospiraceae bacterium]